MVGNETTGEYKKQKLVRLALSDELLHPALNSVAQEVSVANGTGYGTNGINARSFGTPNSKKGNCYHIPCGRL